MTPADLTEWRHALRLSKQAAANALGVHVNSVAGWESGKQPIDVRTALACAAIYHRLDPWKP